MSAIHEATSCAKLQKVNDLLRADPSLVHATDEFGRTPLHHAAIEGRVEVAERLLAAGADVNARDNWQRTPLHVGIYEEPLVIDHLPVVSRLVAAGANVNAGDNTGDTPLHMAATFGETEVARMLIANGAEVNARNDRGDTPLHAAVTHMEYDISRLLICRPEIELDAINDDGLTPLDIVRQRGWKRLEGLFEPARTS